MTIALYILLGLSAYLAGAALFTYLSIRFGFIEDEFGLIVGSMFWPIGIPGTLVVHGFIWLAQFAQKRRNSRR